MEILVLLIKLIIKATSGSGQPAQKRNNPDEVLRQMQVRIQAARMEGARPQAATGSPTGFHQNKGQLTPQLRKATPLFKQRKTKRRLPPALPAALVSPPVARVVAAPPAAAVAPAKPAAVKVDAKVLARWLVPQTLRAQFILTEVFQPPVSLRESHLS